MKSSCRKFFLYLFALFMLATLAACKTEADPYGAYRQYDAPAIYAKAERQLASKDYKGAVESLEALEVLYPFGPHAEQMQLNLIFAYYQLKDMGAVAATADRTLRLYPRSNSLPYVYYMKAMANFSHQHTFIQRTFQQDKAHRDLSLIEQSFKDFKIVGERFPGSEYAAHARQQMVFLLDMLARAELYTGQYYYQRGAYVAAANRGGYIVEHYPQSVETAKALVLMVKSYRQLNLPDKADDALRILQLNYPDSIELHEVMSPVKKTRYARFFTRGTHA